jgi:TPP-dependent pyruvate/acetoin dehydrogenase alpha subunit
MANLAHKHAHLKPKPPPVERDLAVRLLEVMALMRAVEDRMVTMYRRGELLGS